MFFRKEYRLLYLLYFFLTPIIIYFIHCLASENRKIFSFCTCYILIVNYSYKSKILILWILCELLISLSFRSCNVFLLQLHFRYYPAYSNVILKCICSCYFLFDSWRKNSTEEKLLLFFADYSFNVEDARFFFTLNSTSFAVQFADDKTVICNYICN